MEKKLKIILCIVLIILISVISFAGIYSKNEMIFRSKLPSYALSTELGEKRVSKLIITDDTTEVIYDKDGNVVDSIPEGANEEEYRKEQEKVNKDEARTAENYKKVKEIIDGRLKYLGINEYLVRIDENTGNAIVELKEGVETDTTLQYLMCTGDFTITDSESKEVLIDKSDVKQAKVVYSNNSSNGIVVYLDILFNKEGTEKLANISREYMKVEDENTDTNNGENTENTGNKENTENKNSNQKQVTLTIEGTDLLTTHFAEEMVNGELPISLGTSTTTAGLQEYMDQGKFYAMLINNGTMPLKYDMGTSETVKGNAQGDNLYILVGAVAIFILLITIFMIYKFKVDGLFAGISFVGTIALLLLMLRYTKTELSLNAISGVFIMIILDAYLIYKMLGSIKKDSYYDNVRKATIRTYLENIEIIIVTLVLAIIFTFMQYVKVYSFGMTLFYGIISIGIINMLFLRTMLLAKYKKG